MSRLDDISRRYLNITGAQRSVQIGTPGAKKLRKITQIEFEENSISDIGHLLSCLVIAERALEEIERQCNDPFDVEIAEKAIIKLRE